MRGSRGAVQSPARARGSTRHAAVGRRLKRDGCRNHFQQPSVIYSVRSKRCSPSRPFAAGYTPDMGCGPFVQPTATWRTRFNRKRDPRPKGSVVRSGLRCDRLRIRQAPTPIPAGIAPWRTEEPSMECVIIVGAVGLVIGSSLGVLVLALVRASDEDALPTPPACAYPHRKCLAAQQSAKPA